MFDAVLDLSRSTKIKEMTRREARGGFQVFEVWVYIRLEYEVYGEWGSTGRFSAAGKSVDYSLSAG